MPFQLSLHNRFLIIKITEPHRRKLHNESPVHSERAAPVFTRNEAICGQNNASAREL